VAIPARERAELGEDGVYIGDLIGCELVDVAGEEEADAIPLVVGEIVEVDRSAGPVALLVVRPSPEAGRFWCPSPKPTCGASTWWDGAWRWRCRRG